MMSLLHRIFTVTSLVSTVAVRAIGAQEPADPTVLPPDLIGRLSTRAPVGMGSDVLVSG